MLGDIDMHPMYCYSVDFGDGRFLDVKVNVVSV